MDSASRKRRASPPHATRADAAAVDAAAAEPAEPAAALGPSPKRRAPAGDMSRVYRGVDLPEGWYAHQTALVFETHGVTRGITKVAAFDFDGTLARTMPGTDDCPPAFPTVHARLRAAVALGYKVVVYTNESLDRLKSPSALRAAVHRKVFVAVAGSMAKGGPTPDAFRKPQAGMWALMATRFSDGSPVDAARSFYVGDAAGRPRDHSADDAGFAAAAAVRFLTETDFFTSHRDLSPLEAVRALTGAAGETGRGL